MTTTSRGRVSSTRFVATLTELRNIEAEIARVDDLITRHPEYESLLLDRDSLIKQQSSLERNVASEAGKMAETTCRTTRLRKCQRQSNARDG